MLRPRISSTSKQQLLDFFSSNKTMQSRQLLPSKRDLVAVIGTTGVGKSQLAVELALSLSKLVKGKGREVMMPTQAEIINADSMQVYKGLDVITNKMTVQEMKGVPHHLMGFLNPGEDYRVGGFQADAISKIAEIHSRGLLPIAVGGTTYYVQNLIFPNGLAADVPLPPRSTSPLPASLLDSSTSEQSDHTPSASTSKGYPVKSYQDIAHFSSSLRNAIISLPADLLALFYALPFFPQTSSPSSFPPGIQLDSIPPAFRTIDAFASAVYAILLHVDPENARRWHWRDIRKVRRGIEIVWEGRRKKDIVDQQAEQEKGARFRTIIFWLYSEPEILKERLDARVDKMVELGLLDEIKQLEHLSTIDGVKDTRIDMSSGIYQAIGYKEFDPYLSTRSSDSPVDPSDPLFLACLDRMKISTRQYARSQIRWIKVKLLPAIDQSDDGDVSIYLLNTTDLKSWDQTVRDPAIDILHSFLKRDALPDPASLSKYAADQLSSSAPALVPIFYKTCQICSGDDPTKPFLVDERAWTAHLVSRTHRRAVKGSQPPIDWNVIRTEAREKAQEKEKQLKISQASILEV